MINASKKKLGRVYKCTSPRRLLLSFSDDHSTSSDTLVGTECHDAVGRELFDIIRESNLPIELQPSHYFDTLIPVAVLTAPSRNPSIVPDACLPRAALPDVVTQIGGSRGQPRAPRRRHGGSPNEGGQLEGGGGEHRL